MVAERRADREEHVREAAIVLTKELDKVAIPAEISGRAKHFYSIYDKMTKKGREFNEIYDLTAMRVIVERAGDEGTRDCYGALGLIHSLWKPMPGRFKDYIAMPKFNGYRALHTTVIGLARVGQAADGVGGRGGRSARVHQELPDRPLRRRGLRVHSEGRSEDPARGFDADRLRVLGAHRRRASHRWREGQRADRAAPLHAAQRRLRRDPDVKGRPRAVARLDGARPLDTRAQQDPPVVLPRDA
jgi:hypothetical protein